MTIDEASELGKTIYENIINNTNNIIPETEYIEFVQVAFKTLKEIQQYRAIGTIEEFKALKEKSVAKKVKGKHMSDSLEERQLCGEYTLYGYCPNCGENITNLWNSVNCGDCGQRLDWND